MVSMIISEFQFFQVKREPTGRDAVMLDQSLLRPTPEALQAVDVDLAGGEAGLVVDRQMPVAAKHERVVSLVAVGINNAAPPHFLGGDGEQRLGFDVRHDLDIDLPGALQEPENRDFSRCPSSAFTFSAAAEIGLVNLHLAAEQDLGVGGGAENGVADDHDRLVRGVISEAELAGDLPGREFELEEFDHAQPVGAGEAAQVQPAAGEVVKGVTAAGTAAFSRDQFPQLPAVAARAKPLMVFEAKSQQVFSRRRLAPHRLFISIYVHGHHYTQVPVLE